MYAVTKTYKDFNGVERTETKLFNLTETEVMEMELGTAGGVAEMQKISRPLSSSLRNLS